MSQKQKPKRMRTTYTYRGQLQRAMDKLNQDFIRVEKLLEPEHQIELHSLHKAISNLDASLEDHRLKLDNDFGEFKK